MLCGLALWTGVDAGTAHAALIVVPNAQTSVEGNQNNGFPFDLAPFGLSNMPYQQVYAASNFAPLTGPQVIHQIFFRPDAFAGSAFSSTLPNVRIDLSTTSAPPDGLSNVFASNVGPDDTTVFSGPLALSSSDTGPPSGPKNFDIVINLQTPFVYDPGEGNLLLDVRNFNGGSTTFFDAENLFGDAVSRVFSLTGVGSTTGGTDTLGLVTAFELEPVVPAIPEPSTLALLGTSLVGLMGYARWKRKPAALRA